jgi:hypothetical protein
MAAFYMDSSGLVKHYLPETGSVWVSSLIDATTISGEWQNAVFLSKIGVVEVAAAIAKRHRMGQITNGSKANLVTVFLDDCMGHFSTLNLDDRVIGIAINLTQRHPLRGYDAVHLATALMLNKALTDEALEPLTFVSADDILCQAAKAEGLLVENPNEH